MQKNRLFAAGLAAALLLGVATPAMAKQPNKGKAHAYGKSKPKPENQQKPVKQKPVTQKAKKSKFAVSGGGSVLNGEFSIQARMRKPSNGHFNYTSTGGQYKVRCKDGWVAPATEPTLAAYPRTMDVTFNNCLVTGQAQRTSVTVTVTDNGQPSDTASGQPAIAPAVADAMSFSMPGPAAADGTPTATSYGGSLTDGNVKIRNK